MSSLSLSIYIYIYIYRERERERERVNSHAIVVVKLQLHNYVQFVTWERYEAPYPTAIVLVEGCPVGWGCKIHRLQMEETSLTNVLNLTLNNLMVR